MKLKACIFLAYNGSKYRGLQNNFNEDKPAVELRLLESLEKTNVLKSNNEGRVNMQRISRTDKGVHASMNALHLRLSFSEEHLLLETSEEEKSLPKEFLKYKIDRKRVVQSINSNLPQDIRVLGFRITPRRCMLRNMVHSRTYIYYCPISMFQHGSEEFDQESVLSNLRKRVSMYIGKNNYHNFTRKVEYSMNEGIRTIINIEVDLEEQKDSKNQTKGTFFKFKIEGTSFLYHQIRKMIGLLIQADKMGLDDVQLQEYFQEKKRMIFLAPAQGLYLHNIDFGLYHRFRPDNEELILSEDELREKDGFTSQMIVPHILDQETENRVFENWYRDDVEQNLDCYRFDGV